MIAAGHPSNAERLRAALPALAVHVGLAFLLLRGLGVAATAPGSEADLKVVDLAPFQPAAEWTPPPVPDSGETDSERRADPREEGAASPPNLESKATEVVAPTRRASSPVRAAAQPNSGSDMSTGTAPIPGPGTGSGGTGTGTGSGDGGSGAGGGGGGGRGGGRLRPPRRLRGSLSDRDYPASLVDEAPHGVVWVRYAVEVDGRVSHCTVTETSGHATLDEITCRLIEQRFRFEPARDGAGRPIRSNLIEKYEWEVEDLPEQRSERRRRRIF